MFKKAIVAAAALIAIAGSAHAADVIQFDPNGAGAGGPIGGITTFDWQPGNAVAIGGNPSGGLQVGDVVTVMYQANLGTLTDGTNVLFGNGGALTPYAGSYFTAVATFQERVVSIGANGSATFDTILGGGGGTFSIYYNTTGPANNLTGEGFVSGTRILLGNLTDIVSGSFTYANDANTPALDNFNGDNYPGQLTRIGSGATDLLITLSLADVNTAFFTDLFAGSSVSLSFFNTSNVTPFNQVDPSACFLDGNAAGTNNGCTNGGYDPNLGTVNGQPQASGTDLDFQFQADSNQSFTRIGVPEPGSIALVGLGLCAVGWSARRKAAKRA